MLDPLPPDIRFEPLLLRPEGVEFSFAAKKEALGPHIRIHWPWDEEYQRRVHRQRFSESRSSESSGAMSPLAPCYGCSRGPRAVRGILPVRKISTRRTGNTHSATRARLGGR